DTSFLVWTTTPWTLPSNVALAIAPNESYALVEAVREDGSEKIICAEVLLESVLSNTKVTSHSIIKKMKGSDLAGVRYERLFPWLPTEGDKAFRVYTADFVTMDTGTGIVHIAPAYGADDLVVGQTHDLPVLYAVGLDGKFVSGTPQAGVFFKDADKDLVRDLKERGLVWKSERYKHEYPFGWRTGAPLLYFAKDAWYIRTTRVREHLVKNNDSINWVPDHVKQGRFGNWLENNRDWALSRERYWGTPLPVWTDGENFKIIGSIAELEKLTGQKLTELDLHRPFIDRITWKEGAAKTAKAAGTAAKSQKKSGKSSKAATSGEEAKEWKRVPEVIDCWFDSGAMPYAQWGTSPAGKKELAKYFPADFICEAIDQTRGWFYTLLAISTMVSDETSYKNVVCLGHVLDGKGEKMSKSKGNTVDPWQVFEMHGADAIRWHFLVGAPPGNSRKMGKPGTDQDPIGDVFGFFNMLQNSAGFFSLYANVDGIEINEWQKNPVAGALPFKERPDIDRWILSRLQVLIRDVTASMNEYDAQKAGRLVELFTDDLSNWYIRRNRRRFWKGERDAEKLTGFDTLYRCLVTIARLIMPFAPFLGEELYRGLVASQSKSAPISANLAGWPEYDASFFDAKILEEGDLVLQAASLGRAARAASGMKIRQPLSRIRVFAANASAKSAIEKNEDVLKEELNVKSIEFLADAQGLIDYRIKPNLPRLGKRVGQHMKAVQEYFRSIKDPSTVARAVRAGSSLSLEDQGVKIELEPEDVLVEPVSAEGTAGVEGSGMTVVLDTGLTPELIQEGIVRDLVRNIQEMRKKAGLEVTDRITLVMEADPEVSSAIERFAGYIEDETLAKIEKSHAGKATGESAFDLDGLSVSVKLFSLR
ncbi:MAG TPA: class I tRNA ligase family protein, partial [Leptospiraceae bacterium]|nr:class I tRNA ligase family protein [Leptospiraceae bacterium]